jgi:hypothetical protein
MRRTAFGLILAVIQALSVGAAQMPKPALQLVLAPDKIELVSGAEFQLSMRVVNLTQETVDCTRVIDNNHSIDVMYTYDIRTNDGNAVSSVYEKGPDESLGVRLCKLPPNQSFETGVDHLMSAFDMKRPGVYSIRISRPDQAHPGQMLGTSNVVTATVNAPQ